ncbi:sensor histidine kinase [Streptomyces sp. NPDC018031]|uniref:sensor histidine kinase n=1 Tax=Streptomyces sp. NPDC018031 TaxID=3365033 RepID=UPI0037B14FD9
MGEAPGGQALIGQPPLEQDPGGRRRYGRRARRTRGQAVRDGLLWTVLAGFVVLGDWAGRSVPLPWWHTAGGLLVLGAAVPLSRRWPVPALLLIAGVGLAADPALFSVSYTPALAVLGYLAGHRAPTARPALLAFTAVAAAGSVRAVDAPDPVIVWLVLVATLLFGAAFPWLAGRHRRQSRALVAAGWSRAAQLEREQRIIVDRARLRERARIAQDMHDSLGHDLSLIALRAGALQVAPGLDAAHRAAARELRVAAADATERLREIIGVLRDATAPPAGTGTAAAGRSGGGPSRPPGVAPPAGPEDPPLVPAGESIEALVERAADSGLPVRLVRTGCTGRTALAPMAERAAYRVVQESLTNAAKHAPGAEVTVSIGERAAPDRGRPAPAARGRGRAGRDETVVTVVTSGGHRPAQAAGAAGRRSGAGSGSGTGLLGLRERVALVGGSFSAGPRDGGFEVVARLPHSAAGEKDPPGAGGPGADPAGHPADPGAGHRDPAEVPPRPVAGARYPDDPPPGGDGEAGPGAVREFARARRASRRGLVRSLSVGGGLAALVVTAAVGWYAYTRTHCVLDPRDYAALRVGEPYAEIEPVLPDRVATDPPLERAPARPPGSRCDYYRASDELFVSVDHFRLCFRGGRLVAKDVVPGVGVPPRTAPPPDERPAPQHPPPYGPGRGPDRG